MIADRANERAVQAAAGKQLEAGSRVRKIERGNFNVERRKEQTSTRNFYAKRTRNTNDDEKRGRQVGKSTGLISTNTW